MPAPDGLIVNPRRKVPAPKAGLIGGLLLNARQGISGLKNNGGPPSKVKGQRIEKREQGKQTQSEKGNNQRRRWLQEAVQSASGLDYRGPLEAGITEGGSGLKVGIPQEKRGLLPRNRS